MAQTWYPSLLDCIAVPCLTEKNFLQELQRCGIRGWAVRSFTLSDPHCGQVVPLGQRLSMNHRSAVASSGNILNSSASVIPLR